MKPRAKHFPAAMIAMCLAAPILATAAQAQQIPPAPRAGEAVIAVRDAIDRVLARYVGTIVGAELKRGRPHERTAVVYEMRLLTIQGNVLRVRVDAANGDILETDGRGFIGARRDD